MNSTLFTILVLLLITSAGYYFARRWAFNIGQQNKQAGSHARALNSTPPYHGMLVAFYSLLPALLLLLTWSVFDGNYIDGKVYSQLPAEYQQMPATEKELVMNKIKYVANNINSPLADGDENIVSAAQNLNRLQQVNGYLLSGISIVIALIGGFIGWKKISPTFRARNRVETIITGLMILCASIAILTTLGIILSVLFESTRFFGKIPFSDFMFGLEWSPQTAIRADQVGASGSFGAIPLLAGTLLISAIAMLVAIPIGLLSAIYLSEYASKRFRAFAKPTLEVLAGIPTVVYGFFAALTVAPFLRDTGDLIGLDVASESALAAGLVMGIMIIPFVSSLSDDVISAVPQSLRDGSYGLGSTKSETIKKVVFPAALPGIMGGILLAVSRAIGETMIVVMAAGLAANLTANPLEAVTTVTVQIVTLLTGDQEFDSAKTLAAFALGLMLFVVTLILNVIALYIVRKYREQYD